MILGLGLVAFVFDTVGGVLFAKILNLFLKNKINPMIGAGGHLGLSHVLARGASDGPQGGRRKLYSHACRGG